MGIDWAFLIDECITPDVAYGLDSDRIGAEAVKDVLWEGADDFQDILPYVREHDLILVTSDITDFGRLKENVHAGVVLIYDNELETERIIEGLLAIVDQYPSRDALRDYEKLDPWLTD